MFKVEQTTKEIHLSLMAGCYVICKKKKPKFLLFINFGLLDYLMAHSTYSIYSKCQKPELTVQVVHTGFSTSHST